MLLFDDTDMFALGNGERKTFDYPDLGLYLHEGFIPKAEADALYEQLLTGTPWREYEMPMYDKVVTAPRMVAWYGASDEAGESALPWTPELLQLREKVEKKTGHEFNAVLLNLYRNGNDSVSWHSDREHHIGQNPSIASVTFGQTRPFRLRHKTDKSVPQLEIPLHHGTLLVMHGTTNTFWQHHIPKSAKPMLPRINLTFRKVRHL